MAVIVILARSQYLGADCIILFSPSELLSSHSPQGILCHTPALLTYQAHKSILVVCMIWTPSRPRVYISGQPVWPGRPCVLPLQCKTLYALGQSLQHHSLSLAMKYIILCIAALAATALSGPLNSDVDVRAHLARGPISINTGEESTRGFSQRGGPHGPAQEDRATV